jgi:hypothetical protein
MKKIIAATVLAALVVLGLSTASSAGNPGPIGVVGKNTVGSWQVKNGSLKMGDLNTYTRNRINSAHTRINQVNRDVRALQSATDETGLTDHGIGNREIQVAASQKDTVTVSCGEGRVATGGGHEFSAYGAHVPTLLASEPVLVDDGDGTFSASGWSVTSQSGAGKHNVKVWVACATQ